MNHSAWGVAQRQCSRRAGGGIQTTRKQRAKVGPSCITITTLVPDTDDDSDDEQAAEEQGTRMRMHCKEAFFLFDHVFDSGGKTPRLVLDLGTHDGPLGHTRIPLDWEPSIGVQQRWYEVLEGSSSYGSNDASWCSGGTVRFPARALAITVISQFWEGTPLVHRSCFALAVRWWASAGSGPHGHGGRNRRSGRTHGTAGKTGKRVPFVAANSPGVSSPARTLGASVHRHIKQQRTLWAPASSALELRI